MRLGIIHTAHIHVYTLMGGIRKMRYCRLLALLVVTLLVASCYKDSDITTVNDYCYIKSVTLGTVKRKTATLNTTFSGSTYHMTINQRTGIIENREKLPYGSQLSAVLATIAFDGSLLTYRVDGSNGPWTAYNSTDSLDLTSPLELFLVGNDYDSNRKYKLKVNVHDQEGDSLYWNKCEENVPSLTGLTDMKAFILDDKLMVIGNNGTDITIAERSGIEANGTWKIVNDNEHPTNLPITADLQTLRQQEGTLYLSTSDGRIFSSSDANTWVQVGDTYDAALTLIEKTKDYFYAISASENKLLRSSDAIDWSHVEKLDTKADSLPTHDIRALSAEQANGNTRIVLVGQRDAATEEDKPKYNHGFVWNKMWNESEKEEEAEWIFFPLSSDNTIPCPRLQYFNMLPYDGKCIAFGGASSDGKHKALDAMYISQDYGITWRPDDELHMPFDLKGIEDCIASAVDKNNYIWIITNAQVWRGRLNRLGFE